MVVAIFGECCLIQIQRRVWYASADQLPEKSLYRPKSLVQVARDLEAHRPTPPGIETKSEEIVVMKGDDLAKLALKLLGDTDRKLEFYEANRDVIDDPREIHPGWKLRMP